MLNIVYSLFSCLLSFQSALAFIPKDLLLFSTQIVLYLRMCLAHSAGVVPTSQSLADMQDHAPAIGRYIRNLMSGNHISFSSTSSSKSAETNPVQIYIGLLQQLLAGVGGKSTIFVKLFIRNQCPLLWIAELQRSLCELRCKLAPFYASE